MFQIRVITERSTHLKNYFLYVRSRAKYRTGVDDVDCFLACDPTALYVGELDGKPIGISCMFKYKDGYRHGGGYHIQSQYRKSGYGLQLFDYVVKKAAPIQNVSGYVPSLEVAEMYRKYFGRCDILYSVETHDIDSTKASKKLHGVSADKSCQVKQTSGIDFKSLLHYDNLVFGYDRKRFLYKWLHSSQSVSYVALNNKGSVVGYIVARKSAVPNEGYKIGPLFCEDIDVGLSLMKSVLQQINEHGISSSVHICCPIGKNPQVKDVLKFVDSTLVNKHFFVTTNGYPKGHVDKWLGVTSFLCG